jgi:hypothetical protein
MFMASEPQHTFPAGAAEGQRVVVRLERISASSSIWSVGSSGMS